MKVPGYEFEKVEGPVEFSPAPIPVGIEYPHQLDPLSDAQDEGPSRYEFQKLALRVSQLEIEMESLKNLLTDGK